MKLMIIFTILGMLGRVVFFMPAAALPEYPVMDTVELEKPQEVSGPSELRHMSQKMYYLKTGRLINSEINFRKQRNFWGKGIPSKVRFPVHLAMWEQVRRTAATGRF